MTAEQIVTKARSYVGIAEKPNNDVIFNTAYYGHAVNGSQYPWCCVFVWYVFKQVGASQLFCGGEKTAYCPTAMNWFKTNKALYATNPKVGDVVFFNFSGNKSVASHIGIVSGILAGNKIRTIEGNTSSANQTNGGQVEEKTRDLKYCIGFGRPAYESHTSAKIADSSTKPTQKDVLFHEAAKAGVQFMISANALKMRQDAPSGTIVTILTKGTKVTWYGYHKICDGDLWLYVTDGKHTGYMCKTKGTTSYMN